MNEFKGTPLSSIILIEIKNTAHGCKNITQGYIFNIKENLFSSIYYFGSAPRLFSLHCFLQFSPSFPLFSLKVLVTAPSQLFPLFGIIYTPDIFTPWEQAHLVPR